MTKVLSKISVKAFSVSLLFFFSSIGASVLMSPALASPNQPAAMAAAPLSQLEANWAAPDGNYFNQNFNPQNRINSSNAQYLGLSWLFPLPTHPTALLSVAGGLGVGIRHRGARGAPNLRQALRQLGRRVQSGCQVEALAPQKSRSPAGVLVVRLRE